MNVVDSIPMPRVRVAQVTTEAFNALAQKVEGLEKAIDKITKQAKEKAVKNDPSK